jgi:hypothetical protein
VAFVEDLAPFFTDMAAASCTIGGVDVAAIFSNRAEETLYAAGASPVLTCASAAVAATARGAAAVVNGVAYTVAKVEHDGTGMSRVFLEAV